MAARLTVKIGTGGLRCDAHVSNTDFDMPQQRHESAVQRRFERNGAIEESK
jgi:hypothetical protein